MEILFWLDEEFWIAFSHRHTLPSRIIVDSMKYLLALHSYLFQNTLHHFFTVLAGKALAYLYIMQIIIRIVSILTDPRYINRCPYIVFLQYFPFFLKHHLPYIYQINKCRKQILKTLLPASVIFILYPFYNFAYKALIFARVAGPIIPSTDKPFAF